MVLTITEVMKKEPLTILPTELQVDLKRFLGRIPLVIRLKVKGIAMDMTNKHIKLLGKYFPNYSGLVCQNNFGGIKKLILPG